MTCIWLALLCGNHAASASVASAWVPIPVNGSHANTGLMAESALFSFATSPTVMLAPIARLGPGAAPNASGIDAALGPGAAAVPLGGVEQLRFRLQAATAGAKTRVEATTCFGTNATLRDHGIAPGSAAARKLEALALAALNCSNVFASEPYPAGPGAAAGGATNVSYSLLLPRGLSPDAAAILGQFHGRPDSRIFLDPATNATVRLGTDEAYAACGYGGAGAGAEAAAQQHSGKNRSGCEEGQVRGGPYDGWRYKQGGYPPLTFSLTKGGVWSVVGRSDDRVFVPKANCGFDPADDKWWPDKRVCPGGGHERVSGLWRSRRFGDVPLGEWLRFDWRVVWSAYAPEGGALLRNGSVALSVVSQQSGARVVDLRWAGPLGRHDDGRIPYFKIGVYNPSGDTAPVEVTFANLTHATGPPPPPPPPPALPSADGE